jgi:hypothetical protein
MTWDDFKRYIDEKLSELNKDGSIEISYIDISSAKSALFFDKLEVAIHAESQAGRHKLIIYN